MLRRLSSSLPFIIDSSLAPETLEKYNNAWKLWIDWTAAVPEVSAFPCDPFSVAIYLNFLLHTRGKIGPIRSAVNAISWAHRSAGYASPTDEDFVTLTLKGCERILGQPTRKSVAMTSEIIHDLYNKFHSSNLHDQRFLAILLICYTGFLRIDELLTIQLKHIDLHTDKMLLFLPQCKNDQLRQGNTVYIAALDSKYCPVKFVRNYLRLCDFNTTTDPEAHLLPRLVKRKSGLYAHRSRGISYTTAREIFSIHVQQLYPTTRYTLHSLRSGGASDAANNGVEPRLISKHGRWKTTKSRDGYIADSTENRLSVSRALGL